MKMRASVGAALLLVTVAVAACSGGDDNPAVSTSSSSSSGGATADAGEGGVDAASIKPRPDLCEGLSLVEGEVPERLLPGEAPAAAGGTVETGTYDLVELNAYESAAGADAGGEGEVPSTRLTGRAGQSTLVVDDFSLSTIETYGNTGALAPPTSAGVLYRIDGSSLVETAVCPSTALPVRAAFSAFPGGLALFPDPLHRRLFHRRL
ncbi:MAG: hypothetical protein JWP97_4166 [Labilithrix sp.]|nr:hypothetical protein [Labilithrix sp.]